MIKEIEKTCENCEYEYEDIEGTHCRHCIHNATENFKPKVIVPTEAEIRAKAIDEFVKLADECSGYTANCIEHDLALTIYTIHQIAEQLKAGE